MTIHFLLRKFFSKEVGDWETGKLSGNVVHQSTSIVLLCGRNASENMNKKKNEDGEDSTSATLAQICLLDQ